ncbi:endonuclease III [Hydrogenobacter thermophilus TK-6]|uniref:Endonuclease III n=1 Tax=Hydrogenobacter thermophilus (strain DSM 6534 / IAM 12695 / TK-6) TaxID=608538 RepID=D3DHA2_HYDTT|nr:endonuclease III [Hydrogenobacter thermophilus]ADO45141.1 endonuclease III [Hydrogenobacter thermophilus TK-6]BAI69204.1 endonuclease III [Hydrogenobacter thermophilus TK-6]
MQKEELVVEVIRRLEKVYPNKLELNFKNPFELLIAVILAAQTTDAKVNHVTERLFKKYKTPEDYLRVPLEELQEDISSINYYRNKAKYIKGACKMIIEDYGGEVPKSIEELTRLPGVGRKTANMILYNAFGINEGIAVDTHTARVSKRLGLTEEEKPDKIEQELMQITPKEEWGKLSNLLILHGRYICTAKNPKHKECVLYDLCPSRES